MSKVSIVVPSKNVKDYIGKCLDSLINQTLKDIEIICVDAFSTDGTREIIKEYVNKDDRVILLDDDKGSSGYADNLGFAYAKGEYVGIVESDDYAHKDMMECLYEKAHAYSLDYIKADFSMFVEINEKMLEIDRVGQIDRLNIYDKIISPSDYPELLELDGYMWKGIYRKSFIEENNIKLNETKGAAYQDNGFLHQTICLANRVMYIRDSFYYYRRDNENSSDYNPKGLQMMYDEYDFIDSFMKNNFDKVRNFRYYYYFKMYQQFCGQLKKFLRSNKDYGLISELVGRYKNMFLKGIKNGGVRQSEFGSLINEIYMLCFDEKLYIKKLTHSIKCFNKTCVELFKEISSKKSVVIVCFGNKGQSLYCWLTRNGCRNIVAICDNNPSVHGKIHYEHEILSVENACKYYSSAYFMVANDAYYTQIMKQLLDNGISFDQMERFNLPMGPHASTIQVINS